MKDRERDIANWYIERFDKYIFQALVVQWITNRNRSFTVVEDEDLRRVFEYLNPAVKIQHAHLSGDSVRAKIDLDDDIGENEDELSNNSD